MKTSIIWGLDKKELQDLLDVSCSFSDVMRKLGYVNIEGNMRTLKERLNKEEFNLQKLNINQQMKLKSNKLNRKTKINKQETFIIDSKISRKEIKKIIIKENLFDYKCEKCNNNGLWNNEKLTLELEHKNGVRNDNRLENLCFLCPNCHSQTNSFAGKNNKYNDITKKCNICKVDVSKYNTSGYCLTCANHMKNKYFITKEQILELIDIMPVSEIAKKFNCSTGAIRKKINKYKIKHLVKPRGYWQKHGDLV